MTSQENLQKLLRGIPPDEISNIPHAGAGAPREDGEPQVAFQSWDIPQLQEKPPSVPEPPSEPGMVCIAGVRVPLDAEELDLHGKTLLDVDMERLGQLHALKTLNCSNCFFRDQFPDEAAAGLSSLERINLSDARLDDPGFLSSMPRLTSVNLSHVAVLSCCDAFPPALEELDLTHGCLMDLASLYRLRNLRSLNMTGCDITSLKTIAKLSRLTWLSVSDTEIRDLMPLRRLEHLAELDVSSTHVKNLLALQSMISLTTLNLRDTKVRDLSPLAGLSGLELLNLRDTETGDLRPLAGLSNLKFLNLHGTRVSDLAPLSGLSALSSLEICETDVADLAPLAPLHSLRELWLASRVPVKNLNALSALTGLTRLVATGMKSLSPLSTLTGLTRLRLFCVDADDWSVLARLSRLEELDLLFCNITDLSPLYHLTGLKHLNILGCPLYKGAQADFQKHLPECECSSRA